jgi:hypothetical protein
MAGCERPITGIPWREAPAGCRGPGPNRTARLSQPIEVMARAIERGNPLEHFSRELAARSGRGIEPAPSLV